MLLRSGAFRRATVAALVTAVLLPVVGQAQAVEHAPPSAPMPVGSLPVPAGQDPNQCRGYTSAVRAAAEYARTVASMKTLLATRSDGASALFDTYLEHGTISPLRLQVTDPEALQEFSDSAVTEEAYRRVREKLSTVLGESSPVLHAPGTDPGRKLRDYGVGQGLRINYTPPVDSSLFDKINTPALIAGSTGSVVSQIGHIKDDRAIVGTVRLLPRATDRGVRTQVVRQIAKVSLRIKDSIDFCPGGLGGAAASVVTLPMSRLERTPFGSGGYVHPVLWSASVPLTDAEDDVTSQFPTNDGDLDGVPESQPWEEASFALDNCPGTRNADQLDNDADGVGDACDDEEPTQTELRVRFQHTWNHGIVGDPGDFYNQMGAGEEEYDLAADIPLPAGPFSAGNAPLTYRTPAHMIQDAQPRCLVSAVDITVTSSSPGSIYSTALLQRPDGTYAATIGLERPFPTEYGTAGVCGTGYRSTYWTRAKDAFHATVESACRWERTQPGTVREDEWIATGWVYTPVPAGRTGVLASLSCVEDMRERRWGWYGKVDFELWQVSR